MKILGVSGEKHDFKIEGTNISGTIEKGKETVIPLQFKEKGIYRLICLTHETNKMNGPMIAYIVVE